MEIVIKQVGDVTVAGLKGELDGRSAPSVEKHLVPLVQPGCKILVDMQEVTYLSSAGLRILLLFYRQITGHGGAVALVGLQEMVRDTMAITGFLDFFKDYVSLQDGLQGLGA